jgi:hypothetical protein
LIELATIVEKGADRERVCVPANVPPGGNIHGQDESSDASFVRLYIALLAQNPVVATIDYHMVFARLAAVATVV